MIRWGVDEDFFKFLDEIAPPKKPKKKKRKMKLYLVKPPIESR